MLNFDSRPSNASQCQPSDSPGDVDNILISCAGLGMGNASRIVAVIEALLERARQDGRQLRVHIVSWGAGYNFLKEYREESGAEFELIESHAYTRPSRYLGAYARNVLLLRRLVQRVRPRLIVLDSDYHFPAYVRSGCPIIYIGQAFDVVERAKRRGHTLGSWRERVNFYCRERLDAIVQSLFSTMVLVPCFTKSQSESEKVRRIPLIVRKEFLKAPARPLERSSVGLLLSGSELEKKTFLEFAEKHGLEVLAPGQAAAHQTVPSHASLIDRFDIVFTQGGLSSISECIARSKFLVVFPIEAHPEQILNACEVEQLGLGLRSSVDELEHFPGLLEKIRRSKARPQAAGVACNGAEVAARLIYHNLSPTL